MAGGCVEITDMGEKEGYGNLALTFVFYSSCELTYISLLLWCSEGLSLSKASNKMDKWMDSCFRPSLVCVCGGAVVVWLYICEII